MGTISSGIGLMTGIDIQGLVTQLMAIEARPRDLVTARIEKLGVERAAMMQLQARVMTVQLAAANFNKENVFQQNTVTFSNEDVLTATATRFATEGSYRFTVKRLASKHHFVSRSYSSPDVGIGTGSFSFEIGQGQLNRPTDINFLNGQNGIQNGAILITDRAGNSSKIDLTTSLTMQDILDQINANSTVNVTATVSNDSLVITDYSGGSGNLVVEEIGLGSTTAADLGIAANVAGSTIIGQDIMYVTSGTMLKDLNDGNGIHGIDDQDDLIFRFEDGDSLNVNLRSTLFEVIGADEQSNTLDSLNGGAGVREGSFRITDRNGRSVEIDLSDLNENSIFDSKPTLGQLRTFIQDAATVQGMDISVSFNQLDHIKITDNSDPVIDSSDGSVRDRRSRFIIEDIDGGHAATDLGIVADVAGKNIKGDNIWRMETLGDVINAVNNHWDNPIIDGVSSLELGINSDQSGLKVISHGHMGGISVESADGDLSQGRLAAVDLGLTDLDANGSGRRLIAGLNTVMLRSLNGGSGGDSLDDNYGANRITSGSMVNLTDRNGQSVSLDLTDAFSVQQVLDTINSSDNITNITARINNAGNGIILEDSSTGTGNMIVTGELADKLHISADDDVSSIDSKNLQLQYISGATLLKDMRQGRGVRYGKITITDGKVNSATINLAQTNIKTLGDVVRTINLNGQTGIRASINDNGDGLILVDTSTGDNLDPIKVVDVNDHTASDLGLLTPAKKAEDGSYYIDGSYEFKMEVGGGDSIEDIVEHINSADWGLNAAIINDGSNYRISFTSEISGSIGNVYLDPGTTSLSATTLTEGRDAIILMGDNSQEHPLLIRSSSNEVNNVIKGTTLELVSASDDPVDITIKQDFDGIVAQIESFVTAFNGVMDDIAELTRFDPENYENGILFGDHTVNSIKRNLISMVQRTVAGVSSDYNRLPSVGIKMVSMPVETKDGTSFAVATTNKLKFNQDVFRQAIADDVQAVTELFTMKDTGIGDYIGEKLDSMASTSDSTVKRRLDALTSREKLFNKRIEYLNEVIKAKEERLYRQFYAMEQAIASMQSQQSALAMMSNIAMPQ